MAVGQRQVVADDMPILSFSTEPPRPASAAEQHLTAIADGLEAAGFGVVRWWSPMSPKKPLVRVLRFHLKYMLSAPRVQAIYSRWHVTDMIPTIVAKCRGLPLILEVNGPPGDILVAHKWLSIAAPMLEAFARYQMRAADAVVTVGPGIHRWVSELRRGTDNVYLIQNGADASLARLVRSPAEPRYAVYMGELAEWQGIWDIIAAYDSPDWPAGLSLEFVGGGVLEEQLHASAQDRAGITVRGRVARSEAHEIVAGAAVSISAQSSLLGRNQNAGLPFKVTESLMLGVPVVASATPGQKDVVSRSPFGEIYNSGVPAELAKAVGRAIKAEGADRSAISEFALEKLSWKSTATSTAQLLRTVLSKGRDNRRMPTGIRGLFRRLSQ